MSSIDFSELIKSKKGVITSEREDCGNIIGERDDSIIVEKDGISEHVYLLPKSKVGGYDGAQLILNISATELRSFEERKETKGESIKETIKDKVDPGNIKDTIVDKVDKVKDLITGDDNKKL